MIELDYIITTSNKKNFIKLNKNGTPEVCTSKCNAQKFEYLKAKNLLEHLPKTMRKFHFRVEAVPEIAPKNKAVLNDNQLEKKVINKETSVIEEYVPSESVTRWVDKFGSCEDTLNEAKQREKQLIKELHKKDDELLDILHIIEIEKPKDLYKGWLLYKRIKRNRKERRDIKDEIMIVENVLNSLTDTSCLHRKNIQKAINGLFNRKYTFRVVEEVSDGL